MSSFCLRQIETRCDDEKFFNIECRRVGEELSVVRQTIAMWDAAALLGGLTNYFPIDNPTQLNLTPLRAWYFFDIFDICLIHLSTKNHTLKCVEICHKIVLRQNSKKIHCWNSFYDFHWNSNCFDTTVIFNFVQTFSFEVLKM